MIDGCGGCIINDRDQGTVLFLSIFYLYLKITSLHREGGYGRDESRHSEKEATQKNEFINVELQCSKNILGFREGLSLINA